jgi:hypothetical protein
MEKIQNIKVPYGYTMISLDVQSLFISIPTYIFINCIRKNWDKIKEHTNLPEELFINTIRFIINNSYFIYNGIFYTQINGLPMGSSLSSIAASYVMEHIIDSVMEETGHHIELLSLYVDDTFVIIDEDEVENTLTLFNSFCPSMKFTIEYENNKQINFLDISIKRDDSGILKTSWYQKEQASMNLLNFNSFHTMSQKVNVTQNLIKRVTSLTNSCSPKKKFPHNKKHLKKQWVPNTFQKTIPRLHTTLRQ